ncbi:MAG TPA: coproporphyrinogen-III oxidase family protein [Candidatus Krumholzibacteria bacterium]|nr:coproporphyrinogen-III oxidase family protein [Candidatus Krumholzibacteria bacterium]HPD71094.1 coproporphyrinogen-III oxidase family protein [Candidatus Krumholzibacteria bacterium]HRY39206.1 coproporphyrinogen-III oxidase family protein [Candidatus Krumholzibacteria bacterium]
MAGLYVHVPFCGSICSYCHFARTARHDPALRRRVVGAVVRELVLRQQRCAILSGGRRRLATAYVGGGTPSQLEPELIVELLAGTVGRLPAAADLEFTVEANPETLTADLAAAWRAAGVNRVSLGVQSLDPGVLRLLGRRCEPAAARRALDLACRTFARVSADWILGPGLARDRLLAELDEALDRGVEHLSLYILELHPGTALAAAVAAGRVRLAADGATEALYLACIEHLARRGFEQYEVSNFARPGRESRHNQAYWQGRPYLGLGPSASGFWGRRRYTNTADLAAYLAQVEAGAVPEAVTDPLDRAARRLEALVLPLRTRAGLPLRRLPRGALDLAQGEREGLWTIAGDCLRLTGRGYLRIDTIEARLAAAAG